MAFDSPSLKWISIRNLFCGGIAFLFSVGLSLVSIGCTTQPAKRVSEVDIGEPEYGLIGVTTPQFDPVIDNRIWIRGKGEGAAVGAGVFALECISAFDPAETEPGLMSPAAVLAAILPYCALLGGVAGGFATESRNQLERTESAFRAGLHRKRTQGLLRDQVLAYLREMEIPAVLIKGGIGPLSAEGQTTYSAIADRRPDTILEVVLEKVIVKGFGFKGVPVSITLKARSRLIRQWDNKLLAEIEHGYLTEELELGTMGAKDFNRVINALKRGIRRLAEQAVDELLLVYRPTAAMVKDISIPTRQYVPYYALRPISPKIRRSIDLRAALSRKYASGPVGQSFVPVEERRPTLRWEAFPRSWDMDVLKTEFVDDVTYELRIFSAKYRDPGFFVDRLVYSKKGLKDPYHELENSLHHCGRYFWTVRANFILNGRPRMTEWGGMYIFPIGRDDPEEYRQMDIANGVKERYVYGIRDVILRHRDYYFYTFRIHQGGRECSR